MADSNHAEGGVDAVGVMVRAPARDGGMFTFTPVEGVSLTVRGGAGTGVGYDVEWRDVRCLPSSSDADVSRNATPRAFSEASGNLEGLVELLQRIVFGGEGEGKALGSAQSARAARGGGSEAVRSPGGGETVLYLQKRCSRAEMQRVTIKMTRSGEMAEAVWTRNAAGFRSDTSPQIFLEYLSTLCASDEDGWVFVRPNAWSELPGELWWHILRWLTQREGKAVSCSCHAIKSIVTLDTFIWSPAQVRTHSHPAAAAARRSFSFVRRR